jgi:RNA polymerase sigma factor (sigma-70 family)
MEEVRNRLAEVFEREKSRFLGYVRRQLSGFSGMEAEDILADVAYQLLRRADLIAEVENLTAYIYRSLANRITDHRRGGHPPLSLDHPGLRGDTLDRPFDPEHPGPTPEQSFLQEELRAQLLQALGQLNPLERAVWIATEIEGRSYRDLAEDWDQPIGTLLSRKSRATARLRDLLSHHRHLT